jgi:hypothetical protein
MEKTWVPVWGQVTFVGSEQVVFVHRSGDTGEIEERITLPLEAVRYAGDLQAAKWDRKLIKVEVELGALATATRGI